MFRVLAFVLSNVPRWFEGVLFGLLYPFYLLKFWREKDFVAGRLARAGLRVRPREVYRSLFFNGLDSLRFLTGKDVAVRFENLDLARNEVGGRPVVFASIHSGAFEMLHRGLAQAIGRDVDLVVSEFRNKGLDEFLTEIRAARNVRVMRDFEVAKVLRNAVRDNGVIAVMADQSKGGGEGFNILGDCVPLFLKLPLLANRLGASLVFFRTFWRDGFHVIRFERVYCPNSGVCKDDVARLIEGWILEYPKQWAWNYNSKWSINLVLPK